MASRKRKSSILKTPKSRTPLTDIELNSPVTSEANCKRRVSFSRKKDVAEFVTDEATTAWRLMYQEHNNQTLELSDENINKVTQNNDQIRQAGNTEQLNISSFHLEDKQSLSILECTKAPLLEQHEINSFKEPSFVFPAGNISESFGLSGRIDFNISMMDQNEVFTTVSAEEMHVIQQPSRVKDDEEILRQIKQDLNLSNINLEQNKEKDQNDLSDMSITESIQAPVKVDHAKDRSSTVSQMDKENIAFNIVPIKRKSQQQDKILVYDGKSLNYEEPVVINDFKPKVQSTGSHDSFLTCSDISLDRTASVESVDMPEPLSKNDNLCEQQDDDAAMFKHPNNSQYMIRKNENKTIIFDDREAGTENSEEPVGVNEDSSKTVVFDERELSRSQAILKKFIAAKQANKTIVVKKTEESLSSQPVSSLSLFTDNIDSRSSFEYSNRTKYLLEKYVTSQKKNMDIITEDAPRSLAHAKNQNIDFSVTEAVADQKKESSHPMTASACQKTLQFDGVDSEMPVTLADTLSKEFEGNNTEHFPNSDMSMTRVVPQTAVEFGLHDESKQPLMEEQVHYFTERNIVSKFMPQSISQNAQISIKDNAELTNMSLTRPLNSNLIVQQKAGDSQRSLTRLLPDTEPMSQQIYSITDNCDLAYISMTKQVNNNVSMLRREIDDSDMSFTKCIPDNKPMTQNMHSPMTDNQNLASMSMTYPISSHLFVQRKEIDDSRISFTKCISDIDPMSQNIHSSVTENRDLANMSMTRPIADTLFVQKKEIDESRMSFTKCISDIAPMSQNIHSSITDSRDLANMSMTRPISDNLFVQRKEIDDSRMSFTKCISDIAPMSQNIHSSMTDNRDLANMSMTRRTSDNLFVQRKEIDDSRMSFTKCITDNEPMSENIHSSIMDNGDLANMSMTRPISDNLLVQRKEIDDSRMSFTKCITDNEPMSENIHSSITDNRDLTNMSMTRPISDNLLVQRKEIDDSRMSFTKCISDNKPISQNMYSSMTDNRDLANISMTQPISSNLILQRKEKEDSEMSFAKCMSINKAISQNIPAITDSRDINMSITHRKEKNDSGMSFTKCIPDDKAMSQNMHSSITNNRNLDNMSVTQSTNSNVVVQRKVMDDSDMSFTKCIPNNTHSSMKNNRDIANMSMRQPISSNLSVQRKGKDDSDEAKPISQNIYSSFMDNPDLSNMSMTRPISNNLVVHRNNDSEPENKPIAEGNPDFTNKAKTFPINSDVNVEEAKVKYSDMSFTNSEKEIQSVKTTTHGADILISKCLTDYIHVQNKEDKMCISIDSNAEMSINKDIGQELFEESCNAENINKNIDKSSKKAMPKGLLQEIAAVSTRKGKECPKMSMTRPIAKELFNEDHSMTADNEDNITCTKAKNLSDWRSTQQEEMGNVSVKESVTQSDFKAQKTDLSLEVDEEMPLHDEITSKTSETHKRKERLSAIELKQHVYRNDSQDQTKDFEKSTSNRNKVDLSKKCEPLCENLISLEIKETKSQSSQKSLLSLDDGSYITPPQDIAANTGVSNSYLSVGSTLSKNNLSIVQTESLVNLDNSVIENKALVLPQNTHNSLHRSNCNSESNTSFSNEIVVSTSIEINSNNTEVSDITPSNIMEWKTNDELNSGTSKIIKTEVTLPKRSRELSAESPPIVKSLKTNVFEPKKSATPQKASRKKNGGEVSFSELLSRQCKQLRNTGMLDQSIMQDAPKPLIPPPPPMNMLRLHTSPKPFDMNSKLPKRVKVDDSKFTPENSFKKTENTISLNKSVFDEIKKKLAEFKMKSPSPEPRQFNTKATADGNKTLSKSKILNKSRENIENDNSMNKTPDDPNNSINRPSLTNMKRQTVGDLRKVFEIKLKCETVDEVEVLSSTEPSCVSEPPVVTLPTAVEAQTSKQFQAAVEAQTSLELQTHTSVGFQTADVPYLSVELQTAVPSETSFVAVKNVLPAITSTNEDKTVETSQKLQALPGEPNIKENDFVSCMGSETTIQEKCTDDNKWQTMSSNEGALKPTTKHFIDTSEACNVWSGDSEDSMKDFVTKISNNAPLGASKMETPKEKFRIKRPNTSPRTEQSLSLKSEIEKFQGTNRRSDTQYETSKKLSLPGKCSRDVSFDHKNKKLKSRQSDVCGPNKNDMQLNRVLAVHTIKGISPVDEAVKSALNVMHTTNNMDQMELSNSNRKVHFDGGSNAWDYNGRLVENLADVSNSVLNVDVSLSPQVKNNIIYKSVQAYNIDQAFKINAKPKSSLDKGLGSIGSKEKDLHRRIDEIKRDTFKPKSKMIRPKPVDGVSQVNLTDDIVTEIDALPFIGGACSWESMVGSKWSFLLLRSRLRVTFVFSNISDSRCDVRRNTAVQEVRIEGWVNDSTQPLGYLTCKLAVARLECARVGKSCNMAKHIPAALTTIVCHTELCIKWAKRMHHYRLTYAYTLQRDGLLKFNFITMGTLETWNVQLMVALEPHEGSVYPTAKDISVRNDKGPMNEESLKNVLVPIPLGWDHVLNVIRAVAKTLKVQGRAFSETSSRTKTQTQLRR